MAYVELEVGGTTRRIDLTDAPLKIGRREGNTIILDDNLISRNHCTIRKEAGGIVIKDLGSSNGTYVNGQRISSINLHNGDTISVGRHRIRFVNDEEPAPSIAAMQPAVAAVDLVTPLTSTQPIVELDESDIVDDTPDIFQSSPRPELGEDQTPQVPDDHEAVLLRLAESLPEKSFQDYQIALLSARGTIAHAALVAAPPVRVSDKSDAVRLLRLLLLVCFRSNASDIHVEPKEHITLIRIRVDGTMVDLVKLDRAVGMKLTSMVKVLSDIDIAQRGVIQEGHFSSRLPDRRVDYRVSFAPSVYGQKLVIRILDAHSAPLRADQLMLPPGVAEQVVRASEMESGVMLVCGPTGSGKTTTLYALLRTLDVEQRNVITIEDPVEIQLPGVTQLPVNDEQGNSFAALLRSVLRQDPDVILVGEVRDPETAKIAMQAAITGHLVFSTIHTRDTIGTIFRLLDLGVEPYMLAQGLSMVLAQRLVRRLCPHCRVPQKLPAATMDKIKAAIPSFTTAYTRRGCPRCMGTGFSGRRGVFELLVANEKLRDAVLHNRSNQALHEALLGTGFIPLLHHGYQLVAEGVTSLDEVERAVGM